MSRSSIHVLHAGPEPRLMSRCARDPLAAAGALARRVVARRPSIAWSLSLLFFFKALVCVSVLLFPLSAQEPRLLLTVAASLGTLASVGVWLAARRIPMIGFELLAAGGSVMTSVLVAHATTHGGMMLVAFSYPWIAIYSAHFFRRSALVAQGLVISAGFGVGLISSGLHEVVIYWVIVTVTIWSICLVLGQLSESLRRRADTDPLTGLLNRNGFLAAAVREHAIAQRSGNRLTLAVLDLDGFKQINDARGHLAGDRLLADLGRCWREQLRTGDILARHGGDEFVLLLPATSPESAVAVLRRLQVDGLPVSWSVGVKEWLPGETLGECIARADSDLYAVKNAAHAPDGRYRAEPLLGSR